MSTETRLMERKKRRRRKKQRQILSIAIIVLLAILAIVVYYLIQRGGFDGSYSSKLDAVNEHMVTNKKAATEAKPETFRVNFDTSEYEDAYVYPTFLDVSEAPESINIPYAYKEGYRFTGWQYTPSAGSEAITINNGNTEELSGISSDVTLHAQFETKPTKIDKKTKGLSVVMYHYFYDPDQGEKSTDGNMLDINDFDDQMKYLSENDYYYPSWDEVIAFINGDILLPEKSVVITSDDGHESFFRLAIPVLEKYGVHATSFVVAIDFTHEQINPFRSECISFESHSYDMHRPGGNGGRMLTASAQEIATDVDNSYALFNSKRVYCYPFGHINEKAKKVLESKGVQLGFTVDFGRCHPMMDPLELPRIRMSEGNSLKYFSDNVK